MEIRPIRPEDEPLMVSFHSLLSEDTVRGRTLPTSVCASAPPTIASFGFRFNDYDREIALVAQRTLGDGTPEIVGVARLSKRHAENGGEFAIVVADCCQRMGLAPNWSAPGEDRRDEGLDWIGANLQPDNVGARRVAEKAGFYGPREPRRSHASSRVPREGVAGAIDLPRGLSARADCVVANLSRAAAASTGSAGVARAFDASRDVLGRRRLTRATPPTIRAAPTRTRASICSWRKTAPRATPTTGSR